MSKRPTLRSADEPLDRKSAVHERVRQRLVIERLCSRFHQIARQLRARHENRETLRVEDEHDVHDLLHALLLLEHDDVRPETWTPSYAGGRPRTDFWLRLERNVVQAKMAASGFGEQELREQVRVDVQRYQQHADCLTLVCFVYDPDGRIANPRQIEGDLSGDHGGLTVRVIIAPRS